MATWAVTLPITGYAIIEVEAETEEQAIEFGMNGITSDHIESWEAVEKIVEGNVVYAMHPWAAEAEQHQEG